MNTETHIVSVLPLLTIVTAFLAGATWLAWRSSQGLPVRIRFSLRTMIALMLITGALLGSYGRWHGAAEEFYAIERQVDGFVMQAVFVQRKEGHDAVVALLAIPYGDGGPYSFNVAPSADTVPTRPSAGAVPSGVYANGVNRMAQRPDCLFWVYVKATMPRDVRPVVVPPRLRPLSRQQFDRLEKTELWRDYLRPALVLESQRFDDYMFRLHGKPYVSRFTTQEMIDRWDEELRARPPNGHGTSRSP